jgi:MFS family permease
MFKNISRTVWIISLISLFNDFSSEMLYPIIPLYLQQIGYGTLLIGILEGIAECIAGLSKIYMGSLSDTFQRRLPFVQFGYILSILSRPLIGLSSYVGLIFGARSMDRVGKGIRSGARDALLADESTNESRAEVFGFHRSMDTAGAVLGPLVAILYLSFHPENYKSIFFITLIPGVIAIAFTFFIKEKKRDVNKQKSYSIKKHFSFYKEAPKSFMKLVIILLLFSLVNSSDMFLLLKAKEAGLHEREVLWLYLLFNLSFAFFAFPVGKIADKLGKMNILITGLILYALSYFLFTFSLHTYLIVAIFILYGLFYAFNQGIVKALLLEKVSASQKSSAIGFFEGLNSFGLLIANGLAGWVWFQFGSNTMLLYSAIITLVVIALLLQYRTVEMNK